MDSPETRQPELLLSHARWVRELARHLVADPHTADDVAQETMSAALARGPRDGTALSRWLVTVLRNFIKQNARENKRRVERESKINIRDAQPQPHSILERAEAHRAVVDAVMSLDEPYKTAILLFYYDGLAAEEIARQFNIPIATVKTRLARGRERLRAKLGAAHGGGRGAWVGALLPLIQLSSAKPAVFAGIIIMKSQMIVAAALTCAALVLSGYYFITYPTAPAPELARGDAAPIGNINEPVPAPASKSSGTSSRAAIREESRPVAGESVDPVGIVLYGSMKDAVGAPVAGYIIFTDESEEEIWGEARPGGVFSAVGAHPGKWSLSAHAEGFAPEEREFEIENGAVRKRLDVVMAAAGTLKIKFLTPSGKPLLGEHYDAEACASLQKIGINLVDDRVLLAMATRNPPPARFAFINSPIIHMGSGEYISRENANRMRKRNVATEFDGLMILTAPPPLYISAVFRNIVLSSQRVEPGVDEVALVVEPNAIVGSLATVKARVIDGETGSPLPKAFVGVDCWFRGGAGKQVDENGVVTLTNLEPQLGELRARCGDDYAIYDIRVTLEPGKIFDVGTISLYKSKENLVRGHVVDENGAPTSLSVNIQRFDDSSGGLSKPIEVYMDKAGNFRLEKPPGKYLLTSNDKFRSIGNLIFDSRDRKPDSLTIIARKSAQARIRLTMAEPEYLEVSIVNDAQQVIWSSLALYKKRWAVALAPGSYTLVVRDEQHLRKSVPFTIAAESVLLEVTP
ncbi:MAG: sigma-70 family RNA polymerase sigma factor [Planctomycetes bacterium]|nr:sigma-70 family RNA polymerase sigma factor [Planctomycetota bacterium]